jgi:hypothetical protein
MRSQWLRRARTTGPTHFARLFEAVHEGVHIGLLAENDARGTTIAANPHLKLIYGGRTRDRPRTHGGARHRAGARRTHPRGIAGRNA